MGCNPQLSDSRSAKVSPIVKRMSAPDSQNFLRELDEKLWTASDRQRSNPDAAVYKHTVVLLMADDCGSRRVSPHRNSGPLDTDSTYPPAVEFIRRQVDGVCRQTKIEKYRHETYKNNYTRPRHDSPHQL